MVSIRGNLTIGFEEVATFTDYEYPKSVKQAIYTQSFYYSANTPILPQ